MSTYDWFTLLNSRDSPNTAKQLDSNKTKPFSESHCGLQGSKSHLLSHGCPAINAALSFITSRAQQIGFAVSWVRGPTFGQVTIWWRWEGVLSSSIWTCLLYCSLIVLRFLSSKTEWYYLGWFHLNEISCWSAVKSYLTLCNPMDCSTPGFPVLHCLLDRETPAQIHVHWVGDAL